MSKTETLREGLTVEREIFRPEALKIAKLLPKVPKSSWTPRNGFQGINRDAEGENVPEIFSILDTVSDNYGQSATDGHQINRYRPFSSGGWHPDPASTLPTYVLGLTDIEVPTFEYAKTIAKDEYGRFYEGDAANIGHLVLNAGDLLRIDAEELWHRGVNPTKDIRYSAIMPMHSHNNE